VHWAEQHRKRPADPKAALNYARNLKAIGSKAKAVSVLARTYQLNQGHGELASDYGRLALDLGRPQIAEPLLNQAMRSKRQADWRVLSALGTVNAKRGDHKKAQSYYMAALKKKPDSASVYNNLALSYALDGKAGEAENVLKKAVSKVQDTARIRQNLALVLELQNKSPEAQMIAQTGLAGKRVANNKNISRSLEKPVKVASATKETSKSRARADTITTASMPDRKPAIKTQRVAAKIQSKQIKTNSTRAHKGKPAPSAKPVKTASARKAVQPKPTAQAAKKVPAANLPWQTKPVKRAKKSSLRTASLAAKPPQTASRIAPKAEINWNVTVKKSSAVKATLLDTQKIKPQVLKTERDFSFPAGN
jgi:Flp pilus assembly protein TadD